METRENSVSLTRGSYKKETEKNELLVIPDPDKGTLRGFSTLFEIGAAVTILDLVILSWPRIDACRLAGRRGRSG